MAAQMRLRTMIGPVFAAVFAAVLTVAPPGARAGLADGMFAYDQGDYDTAFSEWTPLAEDGDAVAQGLLGLLYRGSRGIAPDFAESAKWYRRAAAQCNPHAQYNIGVMYMRGQGVARDDVQAYMWLDLAARDIATQADGTNSASRQRDALAKRMTETEVGEARRLGDAWEPTAE